MKFNASPSTDGGNYLKIEPGTKVVGVFRGDPYEFYAKFVDNKGINCEQDETGAKFRFKINFITRDANNYVSKLWEGGAVVYNQLKEMNATFDESLEQRVIQIKRNGAGRDTTYTLIPLDQKVEGEFAEIIKAVELQKFEDKEKIDETQGFGDAPKFNKDEELPF